MYNKTNKKPSQAQSTHSKAVRSYPTTEQDGSSVTYNNHATYPLLGESICTVLVDITRSTRQLISPIQKHALQYQFVNASLHFSVCYIPSQDNILYFSSQECHGSFSLLNAISTKPNRSNLSNIVLWTLTIIVFSKRKFHQTGSFKIFPM